MKREASLMAAGFGAVLLASAGASAQESVEACRVHEDPAARIACLEAALTELEAAPPAPAPAAPVAAAAASSAAAVEETDRGWGFRLPRLPGFGREPRERAALEPAGDDLGAEDLESNRFTEERFSATVTSWEEYGYGQLQMTLDNGQVWRQRSSDIQRLHLRRDRPIPVEIWRSGFGSYRMRLTEQRRILSVQRIR